MAAQAACELSDADENSDSEIFFDATDAADASLVAEGARQHSGAASANLGLRAENGGTRLHSATMPTDIPRHPSFDGVNTLPAGHTDRLGSLPDMQQDSSEERLDDCSQPVQHVDMQIGRQVDKQTDRQVDKQTDRQVDKQTDRQVDKQTDRQVDKQTDRQVDKQQGLCYDERSKAADAAPAACADGSWQPSALQADAQTSQSDAPAFPLDAPMNERATLPPPAGASRPEESSVGACAGAESRVADADPTASLLRPSGALGALGRTLSHAILQAASLRRRISLRKPDPQLGGAQRGGFAESEEDLEYCLDLSKGMRFRAARAKKGEKDFIQIKLVQEIKHEHRAAVWCARFSPCGVFLATGCNDKEVRMFVLRTHYRRFDASRQRLSARFGTSGQSFEHLMNSGDQEEEDFNDAVSSVSGNAESEGWSSVADEDLENSRKSPFRPKPYLVCRGHDAPVLDLSWSRNLFLLSASMDFSVRLWHVQKKECLCSFSHSDFVPAITFHPKDDRVFVSGSMDGKLRLWNLSDKKVSAWRQIPTRHTNMVTSLCFCRGGQLLAVGTYDGRILFYDTAEKLSYHTQIDLYKESTVKRRKRNRGFFKITGIETMPGDANRILVSSNDSRLRLIDLTDYQVVCKYKGATNKSHINAHFSPTGCFIISGSEDSCFYVWRTEHGFKRQSRFSVVRSDRNGFWEAIRASPAVVTCALFSPQPLLVLDRRNSRFYEAADPDSVTVASPSGSVPRDTKGEIIVTADFDGCLRVFKNKKEA